MGRPLLLLRLLGLVAAFKFVAVGLPLDNDSDHPGIHSVQNQFAAVKNISKREAGCPEGEHPSGDPSGGHCCKLCDPGSVKDQDCTVPSTKPICKKCTEGEEFMDHSNYLSKCIRCSLCDAEHGLEVEKPCNKIQNVICRCKSGFFCSSLEPCRHCDACKKCENGIILEECTPTKDTICGKSFLWILWTILGIALAVGFSVMIIIKWKHWRKRCMPKEQVEADHEPEGKVMELEPLTYQDIDLAPCIPEIAEIMTLHEVKKFVRKCEMSNPTIDDIERNNEHNAAEEKIHLLSTWYQQHGLKGAYTTLINTLREIKLRTLADKIQKIIASYNQNNARADQAAEISEE